MRESVGENFIFSFDDQRFHAGWSILLPAQRTQPRAKVILVLLKPWRTLIELQLPKLFSVTLEQIFVFFRKVWKQTFSTKKFIAFQIFVPLRTLWYAISITLSYISGWTIFCGYKLSRHETTFVWKSFLTNFQQTFCRELTIVYCIFDGLTHWFIVHNHILQIFGQIYIINLQ